jgi:hypothetical protein
MPPSEVYQRTLVQTLTLPWKSLHLEPTSLEDFGARSTSPRISVGELYHQNSKFYPQHQALVVPPAESRSATRTEFVRRRDEAAAGDYSEVPSAATELLDLLRRATAALHPEALYGIELRLIAAARLYSCEPRSCRVRLLRELNAEGLRAIQRACEPSEAATPLGEASAVLAVIGSFARNEILLGSRGYRRTALDVGRLIGALEGAAATSGGARLAVVLEFYDRLVDRVVEVDGLEQGTLALLIAGGTDGARED